MDIEEIRKAHEAVPFVLHLSDGRTFTIPHRDYVSTNPFSTRTVIVYDKSGSMDLLDPYSITGMRIQEPAGGVPFDDSEDAPGDTP